MCTNPNCSGKLLGKLKFFVSKPAMNIEGLSEATLQKFIELGWISSFKDIFTLKDRFTEMVKLDGFGETSVKKIINAIEKSRNVRLENFICALSIDGVGKSTSKAIADYFNGNIAEWLSIIPADYTVIADIGVTTSNSINEYLSKNKKDIIEFLEKIILKGADFMYPMRKQFYDKFLLPPNNKSVAENTLNDILKSLNKK
jgi:DNA ligase (NAD+)